MDRNSLNAELLKQYVLAGCDHTPEEQLRVLADHFCDKIRLRVAENENTPPDVLRNLAYDANHDVRVAVATNPACDVQLLEQLVRDADVVVRHRLAQDICTPRHILEELAKDENGWIRAEALKTLHILDSRDCDEIWQRRRKKSLGQANIFDQKVARDWKATA